MFDLDNWKEIYHVLNKNKFRTALTAFGVFWGIFMLVLMLGAGKGLRNGVTKEFGNFSQNSVFVWAQTTSKAYKGFTPGRRPQMTNDDVDAIKREVENLEYIAPRNQLGGYRDGNNVTYNNKTGTFNVQGDVPDYFQIDKKKIAMGRYINELDIKEKRKVAMLGSRVYEVLFGSEDPLGKNVRINGVYFTVVGVFKPASGRMSARDADAINVPFTTFQQAFNYGNKVSWFAMTALPNKSAEKLEADVKTLLRKRHKVAPDDLMAFGGFNGGKAFGSMNDAFIALDAIVWLVGFLTLIAGVVGISNIMLVVVKERTMEIGVRRALGAKPLNIIVQIMMESTTICLIAGYLGLVSGVLALEKYTIIFDLFGWSKEFFKDPEIKFEVAIFALFVIIISGMIAGIIPAIRAVKIKPIDALRTE